MLLYERRQFLLELLRKQPGLRVPELARNMAVSEGTIRNDLNALEDQGRLNRVHGGAILSEQEEFQADFFRAVIKKTHGQKLPSRAKPRKGLRMAIRSC